MERTTTTLLGCELSLLRGGTGEPMLYLHGANGAPAELPFMTALAEHFDLIVPEHPGFGRSGDPPWLDNIHDMAFFYLDLLGHLGLQGVHLVGSSLGGWTALEMAVRNTSALHTLTVSAPAGIMVKGLTRGDLFLWSPEETMRQLFYDQALAEDAISHMPEELAFDEIFLKNRNTAAKMLWSPRLYNPHLSKWLHRINVPTTIIWGREDRLMPVGYAAEFEKLIPGARTEIIPECGHLPQTEKMESFVEIVRASAVQGKTQQGGVA